MLIIVVTALHEIKYYQNKVVDVTFISPYAFQRLLKQIFYQYNILFQDSVIKKIKTLSNCI